jgi:two-component system LytT family response regulator
MTIRALIVDDEPLARERIRQLLEGQSDVTLVGECGSGPEALVEIDHQRPDLVFLDVEMPEMDGFEVLRALDRAHLPFIVFVTAYNQYALRAFDVHALDYLVKPVSRARFLETVQRARSEIRHRDSQSESRLLALLDELPTLVGPRGRIAVRTEGRIVFVPTDEIVWIGAKGNYVELHRPSGVLRMRSTLNATEATLDHSSFLRIHRSTIVNLEYVREIQPMFHGEHVVILKDGTRLRLSRRYWEGLESVLAGGR